jgi:quinol monooxygenase YgiN
MILVTGRVTAKPDTFDEMLRIAREHVHRSRKEPGCISHDVSIDADDPLTLQFVERWADKAALKTHFRVKESQVMFHALQTLAADAGGMQMYEAEETNL